MAGITVALAVYNGEKYLEAALDSLARQTRPPEEILAVDNGSTDRSVEILSARPGLRLVREGARGLARARNRALAEAGQEYVAFLDQDDLWHPRKLALFAAAAARHPAAGLVYSDSTAIDADGRPYRPMPGRPPSADVYGELLVSNFVASSAAMVKKSAAGTAGPLRADFRHPASTCDWDFFLRLAQRTAVCRVPYPLTLYRVHGQGSFKTGLEILREDHLRVLELHADAFAARPGLRAKAYASAYQQSGVRQLAAGNLPEARRDFARALTEKPWPPSRWGFYAAAFLPRALLAGLLRLRRRAYAGTLPETPADFPAGNETIFEPLTTSAKEAL